VRVLLLALLLTFYQFPATCQPDTLVRIGHTQRDQIIVASVDLPGKSAKKITKGGTKSKEVNLKEWFNYVKICSKKYGISPYLALALAESESSLRGQRFRFGKISKTYYGPYGIHKCFYGRQGFGDISNPYVNTEVGIRALAGHIHRAKGNEKTKLRKALRKYNTGDGPAQFARYCNRIESLVKKNQREKVFE